MLIVRFLLLSSLLITSRCQFPSTSDKRGLVYVSDTPTASQDASIWISGDLTWYYNYQASPTSQLAGSTLQFVPMLFGTPAFNDQPFDDVVLSQIQAGANITHVLGFNEPDGSSSIGGSDINPTTAAQIWQSQIAPLGSKGVKLGAPVTMGNDQGLSWLASFFSACAGNCPVDFYPIHFYGDFQALASYMGQVQAAYGNNNDSAKLWITEFADPNQSLNDTQYSFNQSIEYFDRLSYVERYSYFGSFRSSVSNVGPDVAMLNANGNLTDIGSWYLGGSATGVIPNSALRSSVSKLNLVAALITLLCIFV